MQLVEENKERRVYSLNLCSWLLSQGIIEDKIARDEEKQDCIYFVFPETETVAKSIIKYKNNTELQNFLNHYKIVRNKTKEII